MDEKIKETPIPVSKGVDGWQGIRILGSNEKLVSLSDLRPELIKVRPMYYEAKIPGAISECYVREGLARKLLEAAELLPLGLALVIWDGWRPIEVQTSLFESYRATLVHQNPSWNEDEIIQETSQFVSKPSVNPKYPSPHLTGGAVDLSMIDRDGNPLEMGTQFDAFGKIAGTRYFEDMIGKDHALSACEQIALQNRRLLYYVLTHVGFTNYDQEWWHYDFGDQFWARLRDQDAIYGPVLKLDNIASWTADY